MAAHSWSASEVVEYRLATETDIPALARLRAVEWGGVEYWERRIAAYLDGSHSPREGLAPRVCYVAANDGELVGLAAGHLTRRYRCNGEVQWLNVAPEWRRNGIAASLLRQLAGWFCEKGARRVCIDVDPENTPARALYACLGAEPLNPHWLVWPDVSRLARRKVN